jgi:Ran GTPase-activating protein (RanGAP) involved in mRNA processing and transport
MRNLVMDSSLKINFIMMYQNNNKRFQQIFNSLKRNNLFRNVISVNLFNNGGIGVIQTMTDEELNLQNIVYVDIGNNLLGNNDDLAKRLSLCPLTTLEVNNNNFNSGFLKNLLTNTKKNFSNLVLFNISHNKIGVEGAKIFASKLSDLQNLQKLNIGDCNIRKEGAESIASNIGQCIGLTSLNLSFNDIGTKVAIEFLEKCTGLVSLNLRENCIRDKEDKEFASKLNCLTRLKKLNLADNCIENPSEFSKALQNLELLNLARAGFNNLNKIEKTDAYNLASILALNTTLTDLNLSGNNIERNAAEHIIFSLNCTNLFSLDISDNQIDDGVDGIVKYSQEKFIALEYLDTDDNMSWNKRYGFN